MEEKEIGEVSHYFTRIGVAAVKITADVLNVGDTIHIKGHTTDFQQVIESMQIEHVQVKSAKAGEVIGLKVKEHVREGDRVYKVTG